jgi:hypothetical protein
MFPQARYGTFKLKKSSTIFQGECNVLKADLFFCPTSKRENPVGIIMNLDQNIDL